MHQPGKYDARHEWRASILSIAFHFEMIFDSGMNFMVCTAFAGAGRKI
jgi:hypothetical protein